MKISNFIYSFLTLVLLAPLPAQSQNFGPAAQGQVPGQPFETLQQQVELLQQRVAALEAKLAAVSRNENGDLVITGVNLYIQNGLGTTGCNSSQNTSPCNSAGNLILGYDTDIGGDSKTGSHNLVLGNGHTYTSYGGLVLGRNNEISAPGASITGGSGNTASGIYATVTGGMGNIASGSRASVSGGLNNIASGDRSSISGGEYNIASEFAASVGGGWTNIASGPHSTVSGGSVNNATGPGTSVSGGAENIAGGYNSTVGGGYGRSTPDSGDVDWVAGGLFEDF